MPFIFGMFRSSSISLRSRGISWPRSISSASSPFPATYSGFDTLFLSNARRTFITSTSSSSTSRMFNTRSDIWSCSRDLHFRPEELESGPLSNLGLDPHPAAFRLDDLLHHRQADTGTLDLVARLERLEYAKYALMILRRDSLAVVAHHELAEWPRVGPPNLHQRILGPGVLFRVPDEVHEHLLKRHLLGTDHGHVGSDLDFRLPWRRNELDNLFHQHSRIDTLGLGLHSAGARVLKDSVDQSLHPVHAAAQQCHLRLVLPRQLLAEIFLDPL